MALDYILHLPMDESDDSTTAYDYSKNRNDGVVSGGATFKPGRVGKAINFPGHGGKCEVSMTAQQFVLSRAWTFGAWVMANQMEIGTPTKFIININMTGVGCFHEISIDTIAGVWRHIAIVRENATYTIYVDGFQYESFVDGLALRGFSINQDCYIDDNGFGMVDEVAAVQEALTAADIMQLMASTSKQSYFIDGVDFKDFGIYVSDSKGVIDLPKLKTPRTDKWDNYHGDVVDMSHKYYEARTIKLSCFIKAGDSSEFMEKVFEFERMFDVARTNRLMIDVGAKPLVYEVYCPNGVVLSKKWNNNLMVGTFELNLTEPEPVKKVLKHYVTSNPGTDVCSMTILSSKYLNIYWGDGTSDMDVCGDGSQAQTITHQYSNPGEYYPVITGCIDEIDSFSTSSIVVWNKL